jgi:hypothetical protein
MTGTIRHLIASATLGLGLAAGSALAATPGGGGAAGPALGVNVTADRHAISPFIYGMAYPDPELAREIRLPLNRMGGDGTTRYNWQTDSSNSGDDWFYMAGDKANPTPSGGPDKMVRDARAYDGRVMLTIPIIDYINKATAMDCSFPVSIFGKQQKVNPYVHPIVNGAPTDAGNGKTPDGKQITLTKEQILRVHMYNSPAFQEKWIQHLVQAVGPTAKGGVAVYELDNEPGGWNNTHRDVHPGPTGHDELVKRSLAYAAAVKEADPTAMILGPGDFMHHYQNDGAPGDGKKEHGGLGQADYYLQQFAAYQKKNGKRLLDYFDEHYYPIAQDGETEASRFDATRSLWDPTYKEKNWVGQSRGAVDLIPSFHRWVDQNYPGTKVSISEWGWGDVKTVDGTLIDADVLGIFARERLDLACLFGPPKAGDPAANAFRIYRNFDGRGATFGDTWFLSLSDDQSKLAIYGAQRSVDKALTLVVINKTETDLTSKVLIANFSPAAAAKVYQYSKADPRAIVPQPDQAVTKTGFSATFPAKSMTLYAIPGK